LNNAAMRLDCGQTVDCGSTSMFRAIRVSMIPGSTMATRAPNAFSSAPRPCSEPRRQTSMPRTEPSAQR
jgi:hypothetical protein